MEVSVVASVALSVVLVGIVTWAWRVLNWVWFGPKKLERCLRQQGLAGNSYRLLIGDMKESSMMLKEAKSKPMDLSHDLAPRVLPFVHKSMTTYGTKNTFKATPTICHGKGLGEAMAVTIHVNSVSPQRQNVFPLIAMAKGKNSFIWIGPTPRVNISNPEDVKDILAKYEDFQKPVINPLVKLLARGLANVEGEKWAKHRKIINPAFHSEKLKRMLPAFHQSCSEMTEEWESLASKEGSCELDVWPYLQNLTADVISRTAFGSSYEEGRKIFQLLKDQAQLTMKAIQSVYIPGWRFVPTKMNKRMKEIDKEIRSLLMGIINKREEAIKVGEATKDDLLGILMDSNSKEIRENVNTKNVGMSIQDVIEECKLFYFAGQETTSVLLVWTLVLLSQNQDWQARARDEVLQVFGSNKPDFDGLSHLKVVTMILLEVLRLYPAVVLLSRATHKNTQLGKLSLPAGVEVSLNTLLAHHDKELWGEDAKEFKPERFSEGVSKATKNKFTYFPFGGGPRICIGQNFAMMEAKLALSLILQHFAFELSPSYAHAPTAIITLQPQFGAQIILHKR